MNEIINLSSPPAIYGEQVAGRAARVRKQLKDLSADVKSSTFDMADLLFEAQENNYPTAWGFASLADYAAQELGLKERKAQYLARITKVCLAVGLKRVQYEPSGISKLREICTLDPEGTYWNNTEHVSESLDEHIVRLILDSDKMNVDQVKMEVARLKGQVGKDRRVLRSYSTDITTWTNVIDVAIERARKFLGSKGRDDGGNAKEYSEGECYECICAAFNADPNYDEDPGDKPEVPTEETQAPPTLPMEMI
jgi:hypothetical protein